MAGDYIVQDQQRTVQVLGPAQVVDVMRVGATSLPHNVYFQRDVPYESWRQLGAAGWIAPLADAIEQRLTSGLADSASFIQDVDASGLLTDAIEFVISVPPAAGQAGPMTTTVLVPVNLLTADTAFVGDLVTPLFEDALAALRATAGL